MIRPLKYLALGLVLALLAFTADSDLAPTPVFAQAVLPQGLPWPAGLPVYDHVVIVVEENKNYEEIIGNKNAPYINGVLKKVPT